MSVLLTLLIVFIVLFLNEIWWRLRHTHGEFSRKFVHITVGCYIAFWPFYLSWHEIEYISIAFFIVVLLSETFKIFPSTQSVSRLTWGQLFFAISVGLVALMTHNKWIYAAAILQMALADGLAAIVGIRYGKRNSYRILGHTKSIVGTLTFFVVSLVTVLSIAHFGKLHFGLPWLVLTSLMACLLENLAAFGLDNLLVPVVVAFLLIHH